MRFPIAVAAVAFVLSMAVATESSGAEEDDLAGLLRLLPKSRHTLADGIRAAEKRGGAALSAKFELGAKGELMLSVYVAENGLERDAEHNVLAELLASPAADAWSPAVEVFEDVPHVARAAQQQALLALSPYSLASLVDRMEKAGGGAAISATPVLRGRRALLVGRTVKDGVAREWTADLLSGTFLPQEEASTTVRVVVKRHESVRQGAWVVEFGCAGADDGKGFIYFRIVDAPRQAQKILIVNAKGESVVAPGPKPDRGGWYEVDTGRSFGEPTEIWISPGER